VICEFLGEEIFILNANNISSDTTDLKAKRGRLKTLYTQKGKPES